MTQKILDPTAELLSVVLAHVKEFPECEASRAALHDLLIDTGHTNQRLLDAARSGIWTGTLKEWWDEGPRTVRLVWVKFVRLTNKTPNSQIQWAPGRCGFYYGKSYTEFPENFVQDDLPAEWTEPDDKFAWQHYGTDDEAYDEASRRAIKWANLRSLECNTARSARSPCTT